MAVIIRGDREDRIDVASGRVVHEEGRVIAGCPKSACRGVSSWSLPALQRQAESYHARQTDQRSPATMVECGWCGGRSVITFGKRDKPAEKPLTPEPTPVE